MSIARVGALAVLILVATGIDERIYGDAEDEVTRCDDEVAEFQAEVEKCLKKDHLGRGPRLLGNLKTDHLFKSNHMSAGCAPLCFPVHGGARTAGAGHDPYHRCVSLARGFDLDPITRSPWAMELRLEEAATARRFSSKS
jgi:hypothetical protein